MGLQALDTVVCHKTGTGKADEWELDERWREVFSALAEDARTPYARAGNGVCDGPPDGSEKVPGPVPEASLLRSHLEDVDVEEGVV